jgi:predicted dienelactone hydrolase
MKLIPRILFTLFLAAGQLSQAANVRTHLLDPVDTNRKRTVPLKIYFTEAGVPRPVVLFSHGLGGSRDNNPYLGNHWAENGYVAVFMQHSGSDATVWKSVGRANRIEALKNAVGAKATVNRLLDVRFVIKAMKRPRHGCNPKLRVRNATWIPRMSGSGSEDSRFFAA